MCFVVSFFITCAAFLLPSILLLPSRRNLLLPLPLLLILLMCITFHLRETSLLGEDSYCRGGIVHSRGVCTSALVERPERSKALWRFRVSTSNSPSGRIWLHPYTHMRYYIYNYAQKDIRVCEGDHF